MSSKGGKIPSVMVNFMCQLDWTVWIMITCPDSHDSFNNKF
jgi:hypothetical protein